MRILVQRVKSASVSVGAEKIAEIGAGLLLLVAFTHDENPDDLGRMAGKISRLRIFNDAEGIMNRSILEENGEILAVSQFTLYASTKKGNRPSYIESAPGSIAEPLFDRFVEQLQLLLPTKVQTGRFGADMQVALTNDGPVTLMLDSRG